MLAQQNASKGFSLIEMSLPNAAESAVRDHAPNRAGTKVQWLALGATLMVTAAVYVQAVFFEFVYDDLGQIVSNRQIKSWALVLGYFKSHVWAQSSNMAMYYRPVFMLWLTANYKLFGLHPAYWHLAVIGLHLLFCVLMCFLLWRLTKDMWVTATAVLLFGLHPAHVESVAWVSGATDPLMAVLVLGSLLCYLKHRDSGMKTGIWQGASLLLASLAVLTKETALVFPALIFSHQWFFPQRVASGKKRLCASVRAAAPYVAVWVLFLIARTLALKSLTPQTRAGLRSSVAAWPEVVAFYGAHGLFPFHLSVFYNLMSVTHLGLRNFGLPLVLILAGAATLYYIGKRSRLWAFVSAWCLIMLVPILNVTFWNNVENVHDRYLYLPSVAICVMLSLGLSRLRQIHFTGGAVATLALLVAYASATMFEVSYWHDDYVLAQRGVAVSPGHPIALQLVGNAMIREQRTGEAIPYLLDSLDAQPDNVDTLCSLAYCYSEMNALRLAEESAAKAITLDAAEPRAHLLLGMVRLKQKRLDEAEAEIRRGIELQRVSSGVMLFHYHLGNVLYAKGDVQRAVHEYRLEILNDPLADPAVALARAKLDQLEGRLRAESQRGWE